MIKSYEKTLKEHYLSKDKREKKEEWAQLIRIKARKISCFLKKCRIIEELKENGKEIIVVGSICLVERIGTGEIKSITILGCADIQYNPKHKKGISYQSKEGLMLVGKVIGNFVEIGEDKYIIKNISKYQE